MTLEAKLLKGDALPRIADRARLHFDKVRGAWVVLAADRCFVLDPLGMAAIRRCDGRTTAAAIAAALGRQDEGETMDVLAILQELLDRGVIVG